MIMSELEWSIFVSGIAFGVVLARTLSHAFWWLISDRRYTRRH